MFVISNLLAAIANILGMLLNALYWLLIIRALLSWVSPDPFNPIVQFLHNITEPVLYPIRKAFPGMLRTGIDLSALIAVLLIFFLKSFLVKTLIDLALRLR